MYTVKNNPETKELWTCPNCKRQFLRKRQVHSCRIYPIELHFLNKPEGEKLYNRFIQVVGEKIGPFKVESLECCIHLVKNTAFAAIKIHRKKIMVDFTLDRTIASSRPMKSSPLSAHRMLYYLDVEKETDIDQELLGWIQEAYQTN